MIRRVSYIFVCAAVLPTWCSMTPQAAAHFPWLAVDEYQRAVLFFGESHQDRTYHVPEAVAQAVVLRRMAKMAPNPVELAAVETDEFVGRRSAEPVPQGGVLESEIAYGVYHGMRLDYYARFVSSGRAADISGSGLKLSATPRVHESGVDLAVVWDGQPLAGASATMIDAEGVPTEKETDAKGVARFDLPGGGLIGFLVSRMDGEASGEVDGVKYTSVGAYATVTTWIDQEEAATETSSDENSQASGGLPPLPEAVSSFGAAVSQGWLYVYSGHIGQEHAHSKDNLSQHFRRLRLDGGTAWEELPMETPLQGLPLVAHEGKLYRVGGLSFRNAHDEEPDMHSVAEFSCYDPARGEWTPLPPLPEPRSSHDAVVIGDRLYVMGGWTLAGESQGKWLDTAWSFDLADAESQWESVPAPPVKRRALALAVWNGQLAALGGMDDNGKILRRVDALNLDDGQWTRLADLPRSRMAGFGISAWNLAGKLLVSGADGPVHELTEDGSTWVPVGELQTARFFHRLMPGADATLLVVAGASVDDGHLATIEQFKPRQAQ